jgi:hypothetical protein
MTVYPRQKISTAEKNKRDKETGRTPAETTIDFFIDESVADNNREEILSFYRLTEDALDEKDYNYVLNPFNTTIDRYKRFGAALKNFDIITPVINLYAGEFSQRFKNVQVLDSNPDDDNNYKKGLNELIKGYFNQKNINELNALGLQTGQETKEQGTIQDVTDNYNRGFDANRVISGQEVFDYIYYDQDLEDKYQDAYVDWLKAGMVVSYKGVSNDDIDFEIVPPWEVTFPKNSRSNFIEDGDWIVRRQVWTPNQILDKWHGDLTDDEVKWLEEESINNNGNATGYVHLPTAYINSNEDYKKYSILKEVQGIEVYHVQHHSFQQVGILTYEDDLGQITTTEVDDTYKLNKSAGDISIEWEWISEVREGWRIGEEYRAIYKDVRPLPYNRMELNNKSVQKLSYNGRINRSVTGKPISIVSAGRSYQLLFNVLHYQFEKIINKNKEKIMVIPQGLIPKGIGGWDEEKSMYYAHANGMLVIDETSPTAAIALQGIKVLDMSLGSFAKGCIELMQAVKGEWWEAIGMNRQRYGDSKASDGKGVTEQAIYRSAIISEELNRKFEKFQEKDYEGLLDISKIAYLEGKKAKYINSNGQEAFLRINPDDAIHVLNTDMNVHVLNSKKESEKIAMAKEYGFSLGQNGETKQMLELIDINNFARTKEIISKMDDNIKAREEAMQQSAQESQERIAQTKAETVNAEIEVKYYEADKKYATAIDSALIKLGESPDISEGGENESETVRMNDHKINIDNKKLNLDERTLDIKRKEANARILAAKQNKTAK